MANPPPSADFDPLSTHEAVAVTSSVTSAAMATTTATTTATMTAITAAPIAIVTDSEAHLPLLRPFIGAGNVPFAIVYNHVTLGHKTAPEEQFHPEEQFRLIGQPGRAFRVEPPSAADFRAAYAQLAERTRTILSIHASRDLSASFAHGRAAADELLGTVNVVQVDSRTIGAAQSFLVLEALRAADQAGATADTVIRAVRHTVPDLYSIYYVESGDTLGQNSVIAPSHAVLGGLLGVKPILTVEDGRLHAMEKVKTRTQAIERLVEFAVEFQQVKSLLILGHRAQPTETTRMLHDRLVEAGVGNNAERIPIHHYGFSLAARIGDDGIGLVLLARDGEDGEDGE